MGIVVSRPEIALQPWTTGDLTLVRRLLGDPAMMSHLGGPEPEAKLVERHERYLADPRQSRIVLVDTGEAVGWVGYWDRDWREQPVYEMGWSVLPEWQGHGIASAAALLSLAAARAVGNRPYIHAFPAVDNAPSNAICAKLGFDLLEALSFEYPPESGQFLDCNDWRLDLRD